MRLAIAWMAVMVATPGCAPENAGVLSIQRDVAEEGEQSDERGTPPKSAPASAPPADGPNGTGSPNTDKAPDPLPPDAPPAAPSADAGAPPGQPSKDPFGGAGVYGAEPPRGQTAGLPPHLAAGGVDGKDCLECHTRGGRAPLSPFAAGGTVYVDKAGTTPAKNAEVRIVSAAGTEIARVYADNSGNFWVRAAENTTAAGYTGARDSTSTKNMSAPISSGACNSCHNGQTTAKIYLR